MCVGTWQGEEVKWPCMHPSDASIPSPSQTIAHLGISPYDMLAEFNSFCPFLVLISLSDPFPVFCLIYSISLETDLRKLLFLKLSNQLVSTSIWSTAVRDLKKGEGPRYSQPPRDPHILCLPAAGFPSLFLWIEFTLSPFPQGKFPLLQAQLKHHLTVSSPPGN